MLLTACGDQTNSDTTKTEGGTKSTAPLFDKLPADIQKAGVIKVGTDATYAPMEFKQETRSSVSTPTSPRPSASSSV